MIYLLVLCLFLRAFPVSTGTPQEASAVPQSGPTCSDTRIWHAQTSSLMRDVQTADSYVGLSPPTRAVAYMLAHLDENYMVGTENKTVTDCALAKGDDIYFTLFNQDTSCAISFPFSKADIVFKDPALSERWQATLGLLPLQLEKLYKSLRRSDLFKVFFASGTSANDVASDILRMFSLAISLPLNKRAISDLQKDSLSQILDNCLKSPVFLVTQQKLFIVTKKTDNGWYGFTPNDGPQAGVKWIEEQLRDEKGAYLIYQENHASLPGPSEAVAPECAFSEAPVWADGQVKIYGFKK